MAKSEFMTPKEVAEYLKVTKCIVYRWLQNGLLRGYKAGDVWRVKPEDVQAFLKSNRAA